MAMKLRRRCSLTLAGALLCGAGAAHGRTLAGDWGFLIGNWTCQVTESGHAQRTIHASYDWQYGGVVLREVLRGTGFDGEFYTTFDAASQHFKGVAVGPFGYVVWENDGFVDGHATERGYLFGHGKLAQVSRSEWTHVDATHYVVRDFTPDTPAGHGKPTDTEDCQKQA